MVSNIFLNICPNGEGKQPDAEFGNKIFLPQQKIFRLLCSGFHDGKAKEVL
jgi:hypothetical protein